MLLPSHLPSAQAEAKLARLDSSVEAWRQRYIGRSFATVAIGMNSLRPDCSSGAGALSAGPAGWAVGQREAEARGRVGLFNGPGVESLAALKNVYAHSRAKGVPISFAMNHGCSLSLYFHDPEGNMLEVFWATGVKTNEPIAEPMQPDALERTEQELRDLIRAPA